MSKQESVEMGNVEKMEAATNDSKEIKVPDAWFGTRHVQMLLLFALITIGYGMRVNLSVGIVAMTDPTANPENDFPIYNWHDHSIILSSFFWGYVVTQIPAGQMAKKYGPKWFLVIAMAVSSLFTLLIPFMAELGSWGVMICRVMQGLAQGVFYPSVHNLLSKWAPLPERSRLGTFVFAGGPFGTVLAMPLTGWISGSAFGWPSAFYLYGILGFVWVLVWIMLGYNSPSSHKNIDPVEKHYIEVTLGHDEHSKIVPTPWKCIFTSLPVWAIFITHCAQSWGFWTLLTEIPSYMNHILHFNIKSNGVLSALPYFVMWLLSFVFSGMTDLIINKGWVSIGAGRKIANSFGIYGPAVALIALGFLGKGEGAAGIAIGLLIVAVGLNAAHMCGFQVNHIDLSPNHAGTLMGITNGMSNICSIVAPLMVQYVVTNQEDVNQWKIVFFVASAIYLVGNTFFVLFGSGEIQPWDCIIEPEQKDFEKETPQKFIQEKA